MTAFNWFDVVLCFLLLASAFAGLRAGFARVVIGLAATVIGILAGFWFYGMVAVQIRPHVDSDHAANLLGFAVIFFGVLILGSLLSALLSYLFKWIGLSWFNHALGGVAGIVRGVLVITVMVDVLVAFTPRPKQTFLDESRVLPYTNQISAWLIEIAPHDLKDSFEEQMDNIKRFWIAPHRSGPQEQV